MDDRGTRQTFFKERFEAIWVAAAITESVEESFHLGCEVKFGGDEGAVTVNHTNDCAFDDARSVTAGGRQVEMKILGFLADFGEQASASNGNCEVHEIDRSSSRFHGPTSQVRDPKEFMDCLKEVQVEESSEESGEECQMTKASSMHLRWNLRDDRKLERR